MQWKHGNVMVLYHQTDDASSKAILKSQRRKRGVKGLCGGAVYFAEKESDTYRKAHRHGVVLVADVLLGKVKHIDGHRVPRKYETMTFQQLKQEGFDSVRITRKGGVEYAVYNSDQIRNIRDFNAPVRLQLFLYHFCFVLGF